MFPAGCPWRGALEEDKEQGATLRFALRARRNLVPCYRRGNCKKMLLFLLHSIKRRRNYCSLLEWQDSYCASRWGQVGAPRCLEEGCGEAAQAFNQGAPQPPPLGPLLLSTGTSHWTCHHWAFSGRSVPVSSLRPPGLLPTAGPGLPLLLPLGWTYLVASSQGLRGHSQRTSRGGTEARSTFAPRGS